MPLQTFNFPFHEIEDEYPETGTGMKLGNSYEFRAGPTAPPTKMFTLTMTGMRYYLNNDGTPNVATNPTVNISALDAFYLEHQLHQKFIYPHPVRGNINCRFMMPLRIPKVVRGSNGILPDFDIRLVEMP